MPQSLADVVVNIIYSTKGRRPCLSDGVLAEPHAFSAALVRKCGCECYRAGGTADHVHLAVRLARTVALAELVEEVKVASSKWLKEQSWGLVDFAWQRGYGAFLVGQDDLPGLIHDIDTQRQHHAGNTFEHEYRQTLAANGLSYDERYVWD